MHTVRSWAAHKGFSYEFVDDRLFDYLPGWYARKVGGHKLLMSDLARLELAKDLLGKGYDRAIWVDCDIVVFDPGAFEIDVEADCSFCKEVWVWADRDGGKRSRVGVNNAVCVFLSNSGMLDFYIESCKSIVREAKGELHPNLIGTRLLTALSRRRELRHLTNVGLFSPQVTHDLVEGGGRFLDAYVRAVEVLVRTKGEVVNARLSAVPQGDAR